MADYYPLIRRAVDGLAERTPEMRRAVYERARSALTAQLRSVEPPLSEADIARERLSLDDAIDRVEADEASAVPAPSKPAPSDPSPSSPAEAAEPAPAGEGAAEPPRPAGPRPPAARAEPAEPRRDPRVFLPEAAPPPAPRPVPPRPAALDAPPEDLDEAQGRERPRVGTRGPAVSREGRLRSALLAAALAVVVGAIAVVAWVLRDTPGSFPEAPPVAEAPRAPEGEAKFADRIAGDRPPQAPPAAPAQPAAPAAPAAPAVQPRNDVAVAQRAILYEEDPNNPQSPRATAGRAIWRLDAINGGRGQPLETVVRVTVEVPGANLTYNGVIRRNADQTLPASHTIQSNFTTPSGDGGRIVRDVGQFQLKNEEVSRGTPLAGVQIPVMDNVFLMGLSDLKTDMDRNTELLAKRNWIDLPMRFASGQRAILSFEKGISGEQIVNDALAAWQ